MDNKYNTFSGRFWAGIIDSFILLPFLLLDFIFLKPDNNLMLVIFWLLVSYSLYFVYSILLHWKYGQTIGKQVMKVRVVDVSELKGLHFSQAFLRDSIPLLIQIAIMIKLVVVTIQIGHYDEVGIYEETQMLSYVSLVWFLIEVVTMLTNKKRRALHDFIAKTVVVNNKA